VTSFTDLNFFFEPDHWA